MLLNVALALLPALSVQVPLADWLAPSVETVVGEGGLPAARPEPLSEQLKLTTTSYFVHVPDVYVTPFAFALALIVGGVMSMVKVMAVLADCVLAALSI